MSPLFDTDSTTPPPSSEHPRLTEKALLQKYTVPGPRYTSYPAVPHWQSDLFSPSVWLDALCDALIQQDRPALSLYVHLPFCEQLCTFCGCIKRITKRHEVEAPYIEALLKEWQLYLTHIKQQLGGLPFEIKELHLGGGTPTFFSADHLQRLIEGLLEPVTVAPQFEGSVEGHPNFTSQAQLERLYQAGCRRISFGVQDYDPTVQATINRIQPYEQVQQVNEMARSIGFSSISHDLIYGLPKQRLDTILETIDKTIALKPDRLSFYSYAHVPWIKGVGQRGFSEADLPDSELKRRLYEEGKRVFLSNGYHEIGMDHFALPTDSLYKALNRGQLHRNFMGYTHNNTPITIGLGASAISDIGTAYAQNSKSVTPYQQSLERGVLPLFRGHLLSSEDRYIKNHILNIMCHYKTQWHSSAPPFFQAGIERLAPLLTDQLIEISSQHGVEQLTVTTRGKPFLRNICMALDAHLEDHAQQKAVPVTEQTSTKEPPQFSSTI